MWERNVRCVKGNGARWTKTAGGKRGEIEEGEESERGQRL